MKRDQTLMLGGVAAIVVAAVVASLVTWAVTKDDGGGQAQPSALTPAANQRADLNAGTAAPAPPDAGRVIGDKRNAKVPEGPRLATNGNPPCGPNDPPTAYAIWRFEPQSLDEAKGKAKTIALGTVKSVKAGAPIVVDAAGEPDGKAVIPTQEVQVEVTEGFKGKKAGEMITVTQVGSSCVRVADDPPYQVGSTELLMLEDGANGTMQTIAPEGRYKQGKGGVLTSVIPNAGNNPVVTEISGKSSGDQGLKARLKGS